MAGAPCISNGAVDNLASVEGTHHPSTHLVDNFPSGCYFQWTTTRLPAVCQVYYNTTCLYHHYCLFSHMVAAQPTCSHLTGIHIHRPYQPSPFLYNCTNPQHQMGHRLVRTRKVVMGRVTRDTACHRKNCSSTKMPGPQDMPRSNSAEASFRTDDTQLLRYT